MGAQGRFLFVLFGVCIYVKITATASFTAAFATSSFRSLPVFLVYFMPLIPQSSKSNDIMLKCLVKLNFTGLQIL